MLYKMENEKHESIEPIEPIKSQSKKAERANAFWKNNYLCTISDF